MMPQANDAVTHSTRADAVQEALRRVESTTGPLNGGPRVSVVEALVALWESGRTYGHWEPLGGPAPTFQEVKEALNHEGPTASASEIPSEAGDGWSELAGWWEQTAVDEIRGLVAKMEEYGGAHRATDLTDIGREMVGAGVAGNGAAENSGALEQWNQELGAYFYLVGKFARWKAAIREGRPVSDDTLHDIAIYTRMVQRIRAVGGWPV